MVLKKKDMEYHHIPNAETLKVMEDIDNNIGIHSVDTIEELMEDLEKDD